ncbi:MAG: hypothetical protein ACR2MS_06900 [Weeksellaceae bacterium]
MRRIFIIGIIIIIQCKLITVKKPLQIKILNSNEISMDSDSILVELINPNLADENVLIFDQYFYRKFDSNLIENSFRFKYTILDSLKRPIYPTEVIADYTYDEIKRRRQVFKKLYTTNEDFYGAIKFNREKWEKLFLIKGKSSKIFKIPLKINHDVRYNNSILANYNLKNHKNLYLVINYPSVNLKNQSFDTPQFDQKLKSWLEINSSNLNEDFKIIPDTIRMYNNPRE